jgi:2-hydroxy-6-oxonona-2,4-dienedioate hydrolase
MRQIVTWLFLAPAFWLVLGAGAIYLSYRNDMAELRERLTVDSTLIETRHGPMEVAVWGEGPAVFVLHGINGGYDQGRLLAEAFGGEGYRWIAVSRFGYLRSPLPADASTRAQAESMADILDGLEVDRASIMAMSGGVPPALQFAGLFPERTSALVLISASPFSPLTAEDQNRPVPSWAYASLFGADFPIWGIAWLAPSWLEPIFGITKTQRAGMTKADRAFADRLIQGFLPSSLRIGGVENEAAAVDSSVSYPLDAIAAPTLVIHSNDDAINPLPIGEYAAANIPGATLLVLESGGHLLLGQHDLVRKAVDEALRGVE